ncbi:hypothetical protein [uncultured Bosea sp.]|uniref:hypothetical protein n=1 Tax=uncultured Bosea sp. TaxID=211457 RepID=UPI0025E10E1E|nr:hypothetical protein [uncultured Bosea sp.]
MPDRRPLGVGFALLLLSFLGLSGIARAGSAEACASRDLVVFGLIERHGEDQSLPAEIVADASMKLLNARIACRDGREADAIAIYADLDARLGTMANRR